MEQSLPIFLVKEPQTDLANVQLDEQTRQKVERFLEEQEKGHILRKNSLRPRYRMLCHGPAGTGKTLVAEAIAHHLSKTLYIFNLESLSGTNPDAALATIGEALRTINTKSDVFLFDEFDAIASSRTESSDSTSRKVSNALLIAFEHITSPAILICATNFVGTVDPAFRRRFDTICRFQLPSIDERKTILLSTLHKHGMTAPTEDVESAAKGTEGLSYHETEELAICAIKTALLKKSTSAQLIPEVPAALDRRNTFKTS